MSNNNNSQLKIVRKGNQKSFKGTWNASTYQA